MRRNKQDIKFIYFDLGGVFFGWDNALLTAAETHGLELDALVKMFSKYDEKITKGGITPEEFWVKCQKGLRFRENENFNFLESWVDDYFKIPQTHAFAKELKKQGYQIGILSNIYKGMLDLLLDKEIVPKIEFSAIILSCDVEMMKPEPGIYKLAQKESGFTEEQILFIDDRKDYLAEAKNLGWRTFLFDTKDPEDSVDRIQKILI